MVKELAFGSIILAQVIAVPFNGTWQVGNFCNPTDYDAHLTIQNGKAISDGGSCIYQNVTVLSSSSYQVTARCQIQDEPQEQTVKFKMRVDHKNMWIYDDETGILRQKFTRC